MVTYKRIGDTKRKHKIFTYNPTCDLILKPILRHRRYKYQDMSDALTAAYEFVDLELDDL
jgi:hypothetical protein